MMLMPTCNAKLGDAVQEEHAAVGQRDLAGARPGAADDEAA